MSDYDIGVVIERNNKNYIVLNSIQKDDTEYLVSIPTETNTKKWDDIKSIEQLDIDYEQLVVLKHNIQSDILDFEKNEDVLKEIFHDMLNSLRKN